MDICLVVVNNKSFIYPLLQKDIPVYSFYKKTFANKWINRMVKVFYKLAECCHFYALCYGPWYKNLVKHKKRVIFFDECGLNKSLVRIVNKYSDCCSFYLWNPSSYVVNHNLYSKLTAKIYSFDLFDCLKFGYIYKPCVVSDYYLTKLGIENEYDLVFIGLDKGRRETIGKIVKLCSSLKTHIEIIDEKKVGTVYPVPYEVNIDFVSKSKVNIEWLQNNQCGETLRTVESIMMKKKMITNNLSLREQYYFNSNNFLIVEDINALKEEDVISFVKQNYVDDPSIDFSKRKKKKWAESFFTGND